MEHRAIHLKTWRKLFMLPATKQTPHSALDDDDKWATKVGGADDDDDDCWRIIANGQKENATTRKKLWTCVRETDRERNTSWRCFVSLFTDGTKCALHSFYLNCDEPPNDFKPKGTDRQKRGFRRVRECSKRKRDNTQREKERGRRRELGSHKRLADAGARMNKLRLDPNLLALPNMPSIHM